jgi:methylmalonyl-CoA mutase N-terminal domain/subunit
MAKRKDRSFETPSSIEIKELYTPSDTCGLPYEEEIGLPGKPPFTRGVYPTMYRGRLWTMRQYAGYGTAEESNRRYRYLLESGQTGLSVAFDLPTQMGLDSDDPESEGEIGKVGVAIDTMDDMDRLFDSIPLDEISTSMTINSTAGILLAMYVALAEQRGIEPPKLSGTVQNDILKEYVARGTYIFPPAESMRLITDLFVYCKKNIPKFNTISISGYHIREAGATAVEELAFTLANAAEYVQAALSAGMSLGDFAPRISFFFNCHSNFFEEIAKFRAARRLWTRIMKDRFDAKDASCMRLRFHTQTAGCSLTAQQPLNNVVRVALQALAAVLGGTQSLHTNSFDEALALPSEEAAKIALRTQQIIAEETGVADTVDPLAGSYFLESLTSELEEKAQEYLSEIEKLGGMVKAIEDGYVQKAIQNSAYEHQKKIESGDRTVVGVNKYQDDSTAKIDLQRLDPESEMKQIERLKEFKGSRSDDKVEEALNRIRDAASSDDELISYFVDAVKAECTLGEITGSLKDVFGTHVEKIFI